MRPSALWLLWVTTCMTPRSAALLMEQGTPGDPYKIYYGKYTVFLKGCTHKEVDTIRAAVRDTDCTYMSEEGTMQLPNNGDCGEEYVICSPESAQKLAAHNGANITNKDAGHFFRHMGGTTHGYDPHAIHAMNDFYSQYRNLKALEERVKEVVDNSDGIATLEELSPKTHEGRTIKVVRIRDKEWKSGRPRVVFTFNLHAREWVSGMTGMYTVEYLISALKSEPDFVRGMEVVIVPMANPDGFVYSASSSRFWRKNRRDNPGRCDGVDLNRNWDIAWNGGESTSTNPCSDVYVGPSKRSEPESQALAKLIDEAPTMVHIDIHCFSELILGPWGYKKAAHTDKPKIDELGNAMQAAIREVHGKNYKYGTGGEVIYLASGVFPDYSTAKGAYGYTYELRPAGGGLRGFAPPSNQILPTAEEAFQGLATAVDWAKDKGAPLPKPTPAPTPPPEEKGRRRRRTPEPVKELFDTVDADNDQSITRKEFNKALKSGVIVDPNPPEKPSRRRNKGGKGGRRRRKKSVAASAPPA